MWLNDVLREIIKHENSLIDMEEGLLTRGFQFGIDSENDFIVNSFLYLSVLLFVHSVNFCPIHIYSNLSPENYSFAASDRISVLRIVHHYL